ncbi:hypothetical protein [Lederbergia lenta]|uniref:Uncharacterized protein n=1 Tax=Lederbergia lenta TaxID=1467 RepID=A0A2X4W706_LEDLE|nr:hypothetical protein [Lederbergia lenta]MEC2325981.1 hypothetical protein [Lederbergia lenta]SQI53410.1 Uncharacterised protein [Lederbergia lenta]
MNLEKAEQSIKSMVVIACVLAGLTFIGIILSATVIELPLNWWSLIDVIIFLSLAYGVHKKSRACAVLLFAWFTLNQLILLTTIKSGASAPVTLILGYFLFKGMQGTFTYHKHHISDTSIVDDGDKGKWYKRLNLVSFYLSILVWSLLFLLVITSVVIINTSILPSAVAQVLLMIFLILVVVGNVVFSLTSIGLGIASLVKREKKRKFSIMGIIFSGLFALIYFTVVPILISSYP